MPTVVQSYNVNSGTMIKWYNLTTVMWWWLYTCKGTMVGIRTNGILVDALSIIVEHNGSGSSVITR